MSTALGLLLTVVVAVAGAAVVVQLRRGRYERACLELLRLFGPSIARVQAEPRELVAWAAAVRQARALFPEAFRSLDEAGGGRFPFPPDLIEGVHARWTSQWLAWEREHDMAYRRRAAEVEAELEDAAPTRVAGLRARLAEIEQEKLQRYQERYEEYVRIGRAIGELE